MNESSIFQAKQEFNTEELSNSTFMTKLEEKEIIESDEKFGNLSFFQKKNE